MPRGPESESPAVACSPLVTHVAGRPAAGGLRSDQISSCGWKYQEEAADVRSRQRHAISCGQPAQQCVVAPRSELPSLHATPHRPRCPYDRCVRRQKAQTMACRTRTSIDRRPRDQRSRRAAETRLPSLLAGRSAAMSRSSAAYYSRSTYHGQRTARDGRAAAGTWQRPGRGKAEAWRRHGGGMAEA